MTWWSMPPSFWVLEETQLDGLDHKRENCLPSKVLFLFYCAPFISEIEVFLQNISTRSRFYGKEYPMSGCAASKVRGNVQISHFVAALDSSFNDATLTFCLFESINEFFVFWRLRSCKSQPARARSFLLFPSFLTLLEPPSPFQINIQKHLIKNPAPHPPPEQDKQIRSCVCSLLAHPIHCFNDLASTSVKKKKEKKWEMARCSGRMWHKKMKTRHSWGWVRREVHAGGGGAYFWVVVNYKKH